MMCDRRGPGPPCSEEQLMAVGVADKADMAGLTAGLAHFIENVVLPLEEDNADLLADYRGRFFDDRGGYSREVVELIRRVRMESAQAGYYAMFCPEDIGGGGL